MKLLGAITLAYTIFLGLLIVGMAATELAVSRQNVEQNK